MNYFRSYLTPILYVDIANNILLYDSYRTNPENEGDILRQMFVCIQTINLTVYVHVNCDSF